MDDVDIPIIILLYSSRILSHLANAVIRTRAPGPIMKATKGSITHRGFKIDFKTKERHGLWQCSARCNSSDGSFGLTVFEPVSLNGFASKEDAEKASLDAMKNWIDKTSPVPS